MQRQGAKIITKKRERLQRPKSGKLVARNPRRSALFGVDSGKGGLRRLDGGVRSPMRTGLSQPVPVIPCYPYFFRDKDSCFCCRRLFLRVIYDDYFCR